MAGHTHVWTLGGLSSVVLKVTSDGETTLTADIHYPEISTSVAGNASEQTIASVAVKSAGKTFVGFVVRVASGWTRGQTEIVAEKVP